MPTSLGRVALVGLPGGGKSTIGRHLARRLHLPLYDTDALIEARIGQPIRAYFEAHGEDSFRDLETAAIDEVLGLPAGVIATGGGAVLRPVNRTLMQDRARVVYLRSTPEELYRRLRHDTQRPLLQVTDPLQKLRDLYMQRDPLYREVAHFTVETGRPSVQSVVDTILMQLDLVGLESAADTSVAQAEIKS